MSKLDRCNVEEVFVVGFFPSYCLPKKRPISLDPFLHPLVEEIEDLFINGLYAKYSHLSFQCRTFITSKFLYAHICLLKGIEVYYAGTVA